MTRYWVVVDRESPQLKETLEIAFGRRPAFTVVHDRRVAGRPVGRTAERRQQYENLQLHGFFVTERREY